MRNAIPMTLALAGVCVGACGKDRSGQDRFKETQPAAFVDGQVDAAASPQPVDPARREFGFDGLAAWAPAALLGLPRERVTQMPEVRVIDARYLRGSTEVHLNISLVGDAAAARGFYETAVPRYRQARAGKFPAWVRHYQEDGGRKSAEACTILQDRVGLCAALSPGEGDQALPYLEAVDLRALDRWADSTPPEEIRESELIRRTLLGSTGDHNEARRVSMPWWSQHRVYKLVNYTQPHITGCYVAVGPGDRILPLAGEGDRVQVDDAIANYNAIAALESPVDPHFVRFQIRFFLRAYFAGFDPAALDPTEVVAPAAAPGGGWQFDFSYRLRDAVHRYHLTMSPDGRVDLQAALKDATIKDHPRRAPK